MPVYNKLKIAIFTIISSQSIHALTLEPVEILSGSGNLLYAEMKFSNADANARIEASLAETQDLVRLGVAHQPPGHLNFFTRKSHDGTGVIVITSSRPMVESELNILIKIKEGNATHIQQVKKKLSRPSEPAKVAMSTKEQNLQPQTIVSEKDIALNLPTSAQFQVTKPASSVAQTAIQANSSSSRFDLGTPLAINVAPVPSLNQEPSVAKKIVQPVPMNQAKAHPVATPTVANTAKVLYRAPVAAPHVIQVTTKTDNPLKTEALNPEKLKADSIKPESKPTLESEQKLESKTKSEPETKNVAQKSKTEDLANSKSPQPIPAASPTYNQHAHIVQANESLWKIAARISADTNQSIPEVMQRIKTDNAHAFIDGNINRMRRGVALNLSNSYNSKAKTQPRNNTPIVGAQKQSGKAKYKLTHAEMSLVAESNQDSAQGALKEKTSQNLTSSELSSKVMTAREKTVKLQKNVSQLSLALKQKDQRIELLNARLALLQQQLQQQQRQTKKPVH